MNDLVYAKGNLFTIFYPESKDGELAYNEIVKVLGCGKVQNNHLKSTLYQLRKAGYKVSEAPKADISLDQIFQEMDKLGL